MKRIISIIAVSVLLTIEVCAQAVAPSRDTLPCGQRQRCYYYSKWYDTADWYLRPYCNGLYPSSDIFGLGSASSSEYHWSNTVQQYAPRPIRVKGLWALLSKDPPMGRIMDTNRLPEYLYLYVRDTNVELPIPGKESYFLQRVASVRWDTAHPKMMCLIQDADGRWTKRFYCHVYEALFDTVYTMYGEYWLGGSANSNTGEFDPLYGYVHQYWPSIYQTISTGGSYVHYEQYDSVYLGLGPDGPWRSLGGRSIDFYGPYGVILDEQQWYVEVASANTTQGVGRNTAYYPAGSYQTIWATANSCYRFSHWNDGVTDNPRIIHVTQDTVFTAYFDTATVYDVAVRSNDTSLGYTELIEWRNDPPGTLIHWWEDPYYWIHGSDSSGCEGDSVLFRAKAKEGAYFWYWSDRVTSNPRAVIVTQDTLLTAIFSKDVPPPACPKAVGLSALVKDSGRVVLSWSDGVDGLHTGWEVAWGQLGTPPYLCQTLICNNPQVVLDSIEGGRWYVAYVRALCGHDSAVYYSDWSQGVRVYVPNQAIYMVTAVADCSECGQVYGGGEYEEGSVATLTADASAHYRFLHWSDGDTANPRYVVVTQDTSFTALFAEQEGIAVADSQEEMFLLLPNPATGSVTCILQGQPFPGGILIVTDVSGREVLHKEVSPHTSRYIINLTGFPEGMYFVTLTEGDMSSTQKLIVK